MLRLLRQFSLPNLREHWGRTLLVIGGTATGVSLVVAMSIINTTVLANFRATIEAIAGPADLEIALGIGEVGFGEEAIEVVRSNPNVQAAVGLVKGTISLAESPSSTLQLVGIDLLANDDFSRYHVSAQLDHKRVHEWLADPNSILITRRLAADWNVDVGDTRRLATPTGVRSFTIRGLLDPHGIANAFGGDLVVADLFAAQTILGKGATIDQLDVVVKTRSLLTVVRDELERALPEALEVRQPAQRAQLYEGVLASFQGMLLGLSSLCLIAGFFIIYNTTTTGAVQRAPLIANMRLIGARRGVISRLLLLEATLLGSVGALLGALWGVLLARILSPMVKQSMGVIFQLRFPMDYFAADLRQQLWICALGVAVAVAASGFAVYRLTRIEPAVAIREDTAGAHDLSNPGRLIAMWLMLVAASAGALVLEHIQQSIALGNVGATLWNASIIVIAVPLLHYLARPLSLLALRVFGIEGRFALESIRRAETRSGITAAAVALVLTVGIFLSSVALSFRESMGNYLGRFLATDLAVSAASTEGGWLETPLPASVADELATIPGVARVDSLRVLPGNFYHGMRIGLGALTPGFFDPARYPQDWYREGTAENAGPLVAAGRAVNISTGLSDRANLHVGDAITLATPSGPLTLPIVGVVPDYVSDRGTVVMSMDQFRRHWRLNDVSRVHLQLKPDASIQSVRKAVYEKIGSRYDIKVLTLGEVFDYHDRMINSAFRFTDSIQLLVAIVTIAGVFDLLVSRIIERRRELALWRLIGARASAVRRSVVIESATVGAFGAILGVLTGLVTGWIWVRINFRYLLGYYLELHFAVLTAAWYVALVLAMTALAGRLAAAQATRGELTADLRAE